MRKVLSVVSLLLILVFISTSVASAAVYTRGYYKKNGTYMSPYYRSKPDRSPYNNYSYPGNYNPYTGKYSRGRSSTYLNNYYGRRNYGSSYGYGSRYRGYGYGSSYNSYGGYRYKSHYDW